jgi:hypothetical protein
MKVLDNNKALAVKVDLPGVKKKLMSRWAVVSRDPQP